MILSFIYHWLIFERHKIIYLAQTAFLGNFALPWQFSRGFIKILKQKFAEVLRESALEMNVVKHKTVADSKQGWLRLIDII